MNDKEQLYIIQRVLVQPTKLAIRFFCYSYSGGGLQYFAVVCSGLHWFARFPLPSLPIVPNSCGDLWWFAMICGGLRCFVVGCGGL